MAALDQSTTTLTFKISYAWWLKLYIVTLVTLCHLTGMRPNCERVGYWINRAIKVKIA
jgi:hypothetical protein